MNQKLSYMHANPCTGKWDLAANPVAYIHSSAGFYAGEYHGYEITHFMQLADIDLTH